MHDSTHAIGGASLPPQLAQRLSDSATVERLLVSAQAAAQLPGPFLLSL